MGLRLNIEMFFEKLRLQRAEKKARKDELRRIEAEAKQEAMEELKPILREKYKQQIKDKMTGADKEAKRAKAKAMFGKIAEDFKNSSIGSRDSMNYMLGNDPINKNGGGRPANDYSRMMGGNRNVNNNQNNSSPLPSGDRVAGMMSGSGNNLTPAQKDERAKREKERILNLLR